jgi:hypothetical protein
MGRLTELMGALVFMAVFCAGVYYICTHTKFIDGKDVDNKSDEGDYE